MMKMHWKLVMLAAAGSVAAVTGAVGVAAVPVSLEGSETLFDFTQAVLAACPGTADLAYAGSGSANGEAAMVTGAQQTAPMDVFMDSSICNSPVGPPTNADGLVVALDSVIILGSSETFGSYACNQDPNTTCTSTFEPASGAAYDTAIQVGTPVTCTTDADCSATPNQNCVCPAGAAQPCDISDGGPGDGTCEYVFNGWRDVLRILLAGLTHDVTTTDATAWAARDCNSATRNVLANSYGNVFENQCSAGAGDESSSSTGGVCTQIRHIFRPDDFSGTTNTITELLNLPPVIAPEVPINGVLQHTGASPFCNAVRPAFVFPSPAPTCLQGADATYDPTTKNAPAAGCTLESAVYRATMQDNDPIRRACAGSGTGAAGTFAEDVCSHSADLGFVLPMNDVPEVAPRTNTDRYNANPCARGRYASAQFPEVYDAITQGKQICTRGLLCPNGDQCTNTGGCIVPSDANANPQCLASKLTTSPVCTFNGGVPLVHPAKCGVNDGRSYNQHLYGITSPGAGSYQTNGYSPALNVTGAYYRIHTNHTLAPPGDAGAPTTCQLPDMTSQIGCLVTASPCSIGYTGQQAISSNPSASALKVHAQNAVAYCVQAHFQYPFSRKLYLNTLTGFPNVMGEELALAGCETDLAQPTSLVPPTPAGIVTTAVAATGFVQIAPFVNGGEPFCEDFNESALCSEYSGALNVIACLNQTTLDNFSAFYTACGDGLLDSYEECDLGTSNGPPPATCSLTCRLNY